MQRDAPRWVYKQMTAAVGARSRSRFGQPKSWDKIFSPIALQLLGSSQRLNGYNQLEEECGK